MQIIRRGFVAVLAVLALALASLAISPASATPQATINHDNNFDPHADWSGEEDLSGAVAMNDAGTVAVFMRPFTDATNCAGTAAAAMEFYVGLVGRTSTQWQTPVIQSTFALTGGCASIRDRHEIILNAAGTAGYALIAATALDGSNQRFTSEYVISFSINAQGLAQITNHFALGTCNSTDGCVNPFNFNLHMSPKTGAVFASVLNFHVSPMSGVVTDVAFFNATSSSWTHAALTGIQGMTSGIARDGMTTFVAGAEYVGNGEDPSNFGLYFCRGAFSPECISHKVTWNVVGTIGDATSAITDNGSKLALGWSSIGNYPGALNFAIIPLNASDQGGAIAINARQMPADRVSAVLAPFQVFLNATGSRVWAVMTSSTVNSEVLTTGVVTGSSVEWGGYSLTPVGEYRGAWKAQLTRAGRLVIARASANTQVLVADRSDAFATWFATEIPRGRQRLTGIESLALNATGSRWVLGGLVSTAVQPIAAVGVFKAIPVARKLPTITGTARIGSRLTAHLGTWSVTRGSSTYQWLRDGVEIIGAFASTYTTVPLDSGRKITVRVTYSKTGYFSRSATSAAKKMPGEIRLCSLSVVHTAC